jgi:hypothetical protein
MVAVYTVCTLILSLCRTQQVYIYISCNKVTEQVQVCHSFMCSDSHNDLRLTKNITTLQITIVLQII